ncbi:hypothetical protein Leryth_016893 [Lithospermum erythrorhizon]|nr:hypothetical protein Leryth_016893 [Lithospermum erythrorhizon]
MIVEIGTTTSAAAASTSTSTSSGEALSTILSYKDLCCLSITCRRLHRISNEDSFWCHLLSSDFTSSSSSSSSSVAANNMKTLYKIRYERDKEKKRLVHRRAVLRVESTISEHVRRIEEIKDKCIEESGRMKKTKNELMNLHMVRQASVALNVWQPEVIRGRQEHLVGQCNVAVDSRVNALEMELRLCKQQIVGFERAIKVERRRLDSANDQLASLQYHPLQDHDIKNRQIQSHGIRSKKRRK